MNFGVRANTLKIQMQLSGLLNATIGLIAQGETKNAFSQAGALTNQSVQRFTQFSGQVAQNDAPLGHIVSAEFNYSNNLDKVEVIRTDGRIEDADPALVAVTGSIIVRFADAALLSQAQSALPTELKFSWAGRRPGHIQFGSRKRRIARLLLPSNSRQRCDRVLI
jgi:hypothetical protein